MNDSSVTWDANAWFLNVTGAFEPNWLSKYRGNSIEEGEPIDGKPRYGPRLFVKNINDNTRWDAGAFSTWYHLVPCYRRGLSVGSGHIKKLK